MGFLSDIANLIGEEQRIKRTAKQEAQLNSAQKAKLAEIRRAAENGSVNDMYTLASYYYEGKYVGYDPDMACHYWTKAAERGHVDSMYNLGMLYHGSVSNHYIDENLAGYWFYQASRRGDQDSKDMLDRYYSYRSRKGNGGKWVRRDTTADRQTSEDSSESQWSVAFWWRF